MAGETGETPSEVVAQQTQPQKESFVTRFKNRLLGRSSQPQPQGEGLVGTKTTEQIRQTAQQIPATPELPQEKVPAPGEPGYEPLTKESTTPEWERRAQLEAAALQIRASQVESTGIAQQPVKSPDQLAEEARIDAANLAKAVQPSVPLPKVAPFVESPTTSPTTLPEKVFEPQPEVPGEHEEVDEFLKTKPQPSVETPVPTSPGEAIPVQSSPEEEQPIPVNIPQRTPVNVGDEVR